MKSLLASLCAVLLILLATASAHAQGTAFAEIVGGLASPLGDEDYEDFVNNSIKLGVRAGVYRSQPLSGGAHLALEVGADWALADNDLDDDPNVEAPFHRVRVLAGARVNVGLARKASLFVRVGAGLDYVTGSISAFGITVDDDDIGLGFEAGGGIVVETGGYTVGMQLALPIAWHDDDDTEAPLYEYTSYELDLLATVGARF